MRTALSGFQVAGASHAGQLLGPLFDGSEKEARGEFLGQVASIKLGDAYKAAFATWNAATNPTIAATTSGPLAIGLGNASPYEVGLTLHHTYGVPYLPGSALKGLARRAALQQGLSPEAITVLFGEQDLKKEANAAHIIWWDGWLDSQTARPLQLDTITVHHQKYYGGAGREGYPTDFDDPNPVAFLSVPTGTKFHLALGKSTPELDDRWIYLAAQLLGHGLTHLGLGGKTNAGYGGFDVALPPRPLSAAEIREAEEQTAQLNAEKARGDADRLTVRIREDLKNARAIRDNSARVLGQIAALPLPQREQAVQAVVEQAKTFGEKELAKKARKLLEDG